MKKQKGKMITSSVVNKISKLTQRKTDSTMICTRGRGCKALAFVQGEEFGRVRRDWWRPENTKNNDQSFCNLITSKEVTYHRAADNSHSTEEVLSIVGDDCSVPNAGQFFACQQDILVNKVDVNKRRASSYQ